jgi:isopenicillin-N epimerase
MAKFGHEMRTHWSLDPDVIYLNHGTVGAPPRCVLEVQQKLRDEIERQPSRFLLRELAGVGLGAERSKTPRLRAAADEVARFLGAEGKDLVFVDNATSGINAVLRAFKFNEGDEVVVLNQVYGAVRNAAEYATGVCGAKMRVIELPEPVISPDSVVRSIQDSIGPRTRLALIDHIVSDSGLVLPIAEIASQCKERDVAVLVDGAHAPGAIELDISSLGVDWYAGNLHKWAWSPRSSGILWTAPSRQAELHHPVVSWGFGQGISEEFDWPGTRDPTPHLAAPAGIAFMRELGVRNVQGYNHRLAWEAGCEMAARWDSNPVAPEEMIGSMVTVPLPQRLGSSREDAMRIRDALLFGHNIEAHVHAWKGRIRVRVSAQVYNELSDIECLIRAMEVIARAR